MSGTSGSVRKWLRVASIVVVVAASFSFTIPALGAPGDLTLASTTSEGEKGDRASTSPSISADGTKVAFVSDSLNLDSLVTEIRTSVYVKDLVTGELALASTSTGGVAWDNGGSGHPALSADGSHVAFVSGGNNLVPSDTNSALDVFVKDLATDETTLVSVSQAGEQGNHNSIFPAISADGTKVAFQSATFAPRWVSDDFDDDIYVKDLLSGELTLVSSSDSGVSGSGESRHPAISADGTKVAFESSANNLDPADGDSEFDVYVKDLITGDLTLVSTSTAGTKGNDDSFFSDSSAAEDPHVEPFSRDGTAVAFMSNATNLDSDDTDSTLDIYVKDLASGVLTLASTSDAGVKANGANESPSLTFDGTKVTFTSLATNLDCLDPHPLHDVYVKDLLTGDITLLSITASGQKGNGVSMDPAISSDGSSVAFRSDSTNLHPSDPDGSTDIYVKEPKPTSCPGAAADLSIVKSDSPDPATVGHPLVYNLDVDNAGPGEAGTVVVTDGLPRPLPSARRAPPREHARSPPEPSPATSGPSRVGKARR